ncbi:MAG: 4-hydroxy-tetrahydrodipicolinate reductase [Phycisphaerales bacterium]|jgi:4-hydroxy-tetrahydrodipicolinate reductase|nr:4-hydroxy-tetrahydrodipicolinate reductase [Phycisphaerales bacterium]
MSTIHIIIHGAAGRMGRRIAHLASRDRLFVIDALVVRAGSSIISSSCDEAPMHRFIARDEIDASRLAAMRTPRCIIDFSSDSGLISSIALAREARTPLLAGTTGIAPSTTAMLRDLAAHVPVMATPNTSLGVAAVAAAARHLASVLRSARGDDGDGYHLSVVETHHTRKKDAPSGTALRLASALRDGGGVIADQDIIAHRVGEVIGTHTITFRGPFDTITLTHEAHSRDLFARGALTAAAWLSTRPPGWYTVEDMMR